MQKKYLGVFFGLIFSASSLWSDLVWAESISVPINNSGTPPTDLIYQGKPIDRDDLVKLSEGGTDLSRLEPTPSDVWSSNSLPTVDEQAGNYPLEGSKVDLVSEMTSSRFMYRTRVSQIQNGQNRIFQAIVSLDVHAALARNALLRKLGYPIPSPKYYKNLTIRFPNIAARDHYISQISDQTFTDSRDRRPKSERSNAQSVPVSWYVSESKSSPELTMRDLVLEPAQIDVPGYHWVGVSQRGIKGRRALRALILPMALLDIPENINSYSWELGKRLNNSVVLTHFYAANFSEVTFTDLQWAARKIALLSRAEIAEIVHASHYPDEIEALVTEKVIARRNQMVALFSLDKDLANAQIKLPYDATINRGAVQNGKLLQEWFPEHVEWFRPPPPESPLTADEIKRYFFMDGLSVGLQSLTEKFNENLKLQLNGLSAAEHQQKIIDFFREVQKNPQIPHALPFGSFGGAVAGASVTINRSIVSGEYYGGESKVQLVDNVSVQMSLGYFLSYDGNANIFPGLSSNVVIQRNYIHLRPVSSIKDAMKTDWKSLLVEPYMEHLAAQLDEGHLKSGETPAQRFDREQTALKSFLDSLRTNELFYVTDSIVLNNQVSASIPLGPLLDISFVGFDPKLGLSIGKQAAILKRTVFARTDSGVQIYLQNMKTNADSIEFNFKWWINVFKLSRERKVGSADTRAFLLDQAEDTDDIRAKQIAAIRGVMRGNDTHFLESNFREYKLHHDASSVINRGQFLLWKWNGFEASHLVKIKPPADMLDPAHPRYNPDEYERSLYSYEIAHTEGSDRFGFMGELIGKSQPILGKFTANTVGDNPANSFLGEAFWTKVTTEAEITPAQEFDSVSTIEHHWGGWEISKSKFFGILDGIENRVRVLNLEKPIFRRDEFSEMKSLQLYDIASVLIVYKEGAAKLRNTLSENSKVLEVLRELVGLDGGEPELQRWCSYNATLKSDYSDLDIQSDFHAYRGYENGAPVDIPCLKPWMRELMYLRAEFPKTAAEKVRWQTKVLEKLERNLPLPRLLTWLGKENYFFRVKITGFRTQDDNGDSDYTSDSLGTYNEKDGFGIFKDFASRYHLLSYELYANYLNNGY